MTARRPWWKRKRWWAAVVLWLLVAYPLSLGPLIYLNWRGWFSGYQWSRLYTPIDRLGIRPALEASGFDAYLDWWADLGHRHRSPPQEKHRASD